MKSILSKFARNYLLLLTCLVAWSGIAESASISGPAPNFTLKSLSGKNIKLSELTGNVVLVNFWASWCGPCRQEMPLLDAIHKKYEPLGFTVLGINVEEQVANAKSFIDERPVDFPILFDSNNQVSKLYNVIAMPTTVVIDRDGKIRYIHQGYQSGDEVKYRKMVKTLVRE